MRTPAVRVLFALVSILAVAPAGCHTAPSPADLLARIRETFEVPEAVGLFRLADADISSESATFHYEQVGGPGRAWVIRFPLDEREQRPEAFLNLEPLLAEIQQGRQEFRIERQTQLIEPGGRGVSGRTAEFTFREGEVPWRGKVVVEISTRLRTGWASVLQVIYPAGEPPADLDRLVRELTL